jgi:hypothetical protein
MPYPFDSDPAQRSLHRGPKLGDVFIVAGAFRMKTSEQHEQRRCIDAAVIKSEWNFAQRRHFAAAHFMQDFSGLGIGQGVETLRLVSRQPPQHAARDAWIPPQHLQCRDQPVAAECGRVPGDTGVGISSLRRIRHEHG